MERPSEITGMLEALNENQLARATGFKALKRYFGEGVTERINIGSPEVPRIIEPGVDQDEYHQFLLDSKAAHLASSPPEGEVVDGKEEK
jgi:hypothetical protein